MATTAQGNQILLFKPTNIANCVLWLDASDLTTLYTDTGGTNRISVSGQSIGLWKDKSSLANNATNATNQPTVSFSGQGNLPVLNFNGAQYLNLDVAKLPTGSTPFSFFFIMRTVSQSVQVYFTYGTATNGRCVQLYFANYVLANDLYGAAGPSDNTPYNSTYVLMTTTASSTLYRGFDYGNPYSNNDVAITLNTGSSFAYVGVGQVSNTLTYYLTGQIAEIIAYNRVVSTQEQQQIEGYLAWKWGLQKNLTPGHPYANVNQLTPLYPALPYTYPLPPSAIQTQRPLPLSIANSARVQQSKNYILDLPNSFSFSFLEFPPGSPLFLQGTTAYINNQIRLTDTTASAAGSVFFNKKVRISNFSVSFVMRFELTNADGSTFVIQNYSPTALGTVGGGLAYTGINSSVAIRLDTYSGTGGIFSTDLLSGGTIPSDLGGSGNLNTTFGLSAGGTWNFRVSASYNGTIFSYTIQNVSNPSQSFSSNSTINLASFLGGSTAWIGFTSATGGSTERCFVSSWTWSNAK